MIPEIPKAIFQMNPQKIKIKKPKATPVCCEIISIKFDHHMQIISAINFLAQDS